MLIHDRTIFVCRRQYLLAREFGDYLLSYEDTQLREVST